MTLDIDRAPLPDVASALRASLNKLQDRDHDFALSLIAATESRRGPSPKQAEWLRKLCHKAITPAAPAPTIATPDLSPIIAWLTKAGEKLRRPHFKFSVEGLGVVKIQLAGEASPQPGTGAIYHRNRSGERVFLGRVTKAGTYQPGAKCTADQARDVAAALGPFAADPAKAAGAFGQATGQCCFCAIPLSDARSVTVGYGPICAEKWGLPWGNRPEAQAIAF